MSMDSGHIGELRLLPLFVNLYCKTTKSSYLKTIKEDREVISNHLLKSLLQDLNYGA